MRTILAAILLPLLFAGPEDESPPRLTEALVAPLEWRNIGPANMGGRVTDLAVHPESPRIFYAATASGGLFKTTSGGIAFEPVFDGEGSASVGAVALAPSAPETVWVGTGEANPRNSVSWGDGVYRSDDGGETWTHRGLEGSRHVGGIALHPKDPRTVLVAAMGSTWGPSPERGLYRTRDGGESWERVLFVDEETGCIDVRIDPDRPEVVYAATWQRQRDEFDGGDPAVRTGPGSGLWRSTDGGDSWERLQGGLPTASMGRIGLDLYRADPRILYAIVETERTGERGAPPRSEERVSLGIKGRDAEEGGFLVESVTEGESAAQAGLQVGDVIRGLDAAEVDGRAALVSAMSGYAPGDEAQVVYLREGEELTAAFHFLGRLLRGRARSFASSQGGQVANAQDEQGENGFESGGVFRSEDRGTTWKRVNSINPRPFYYSQVRVDPTDEKKVWVLGISMHRSLDGGQSFETVARSVHADHHALWIDPLRPDRVLLGGDGGLYASWDGGEVWDHLDVLCIGQLYNVAVDTRTPYRVYGGLQDNGSWGGPSATRGRGIGVGDWIKINGGDGFHCAVDPTDPDTVYSESQNGSIMRLDLRTGARARVMPPGDRRGQRFNWNTPFLLSPHNPSILFYAGSRVYRSIDRGESSVEISPEISRTERGSATALAQSPRDENLLYVGTDDGALWASRDGGREWVDLREKLPGIEQPLYVSDIEPSPHRARSVYLTLDGHRSNDFAPHVFFSDDAGESWEAIDEGLPESSVRCIAVDRINRGLLFVGTEQGCFVSIDAGEHWTAFESGLPTVPVHDLVIHPREADLVAATHGRGVWIADIGPLQTLDSETLTQEAHLFPVQSVTRWSAPPGPEWSGERRFAGENPARGAAVYYYLREDRGEAVALTVRDALGATLRTLEGPGEAGLHLVRWDLRARRGRGGGGGAAFFRGGMGGGVEVGDYSVALEIGDEPPVRGIRVLPDPLEAAPAD